MKIRVSGHRQSVIANQVVRIDTGDTVFHVAIRGHEPDIVDVFIPSPFKILELDFVNMKEDKDGQREINRSPTIGGGAQPESQPELTPRDTSSPSELEQVDNTNASSEIRETESNPHTDISPYGPGKSTIVDK